MRYAAPLLLLALAAGCATSEPAGPVADARLPADTNVQAAVALARANLGDFTRKLDRGETFRPAVRYLPAGADYDASVWANVREFDRGEGTFDAYRTDEPLTSEPSPDGPAVTVPVGDVVDFAYLSDSRRIEGGYTLNLDEQGNRVGR